jgi:hypothetical protein
VFINASPQGWHSAVDSPVFSAKADRWGYISHGAEGSSVHLQGQLLAREEAARDLAISPDGRRHVYLAARGTLFEIVDEIGRHPFEMVIEGTLQFNEAGSWMALAGDPTRRRLFLVVDGADTGLQLEWTELIRFATGADPEAELRRWVAAAAALHSSTPAPRR